MNIEILYEDHHFLIVNKPAGLVVHATLDKKRENLYDLLKKNYSYLGLIHRLDKETSGAILFSKNAEINPFIQKEFETHRLEKKYWAIVHGNWIIDQRLEMFLKKIKNNKKQDIMIKVDKGGVKSISQIKTLSSNEKYSLLEFTLLTGRMHQIRAQAKSVGHPIIGDLIYGDLELDKLIKPQRMLLHSYSLNFLLEDKKIQAIATIDHEFKNWIEQTK
jgi:23S rRNA pseudouridine1911/1915/1917 synthase